MEEKIFIVYDDNSEEIYLVKAKTKNNARDIVYDAYIIPYSNNNRGYISSTKSELRVETIDDSFNGQKVVCLN